MLVQSKPAELIKGSAVWYNDKTVKAGWPWIQGRLTSDPGNSYNVLLETGQTIVADTCEAANPPIQEGSNDLMQLTHLNEPSLLYNMQTRFQSDIIYTLAGTVLIAVNPFKHLDLYGDETKNQYRGAAASARVSQTANFGSLYSPTELPPHIYSIAGDAFRRMERDGRSQSIVISGESGSGKTESTKHALKYLANLSNKMKGAGQGHSYEQKLLETNPILEAFGNAKTVRNDNSSRFGKLIQIHFNHKLHIVGAGMRTYLLEKSRVVRQASKERSYHIFYQLIAGASDAQRAQLHLPSDPAAFSYLAKAQLTVDGQDDVSNFAEVCQALQSLGFSETEMTELLQLVAGVLWLGNIAFEEGDNDSSDISQDDAAKNAADLLSVNADTLAFALTKKTIKGLGAAKNLNKTLASECRDALAKAVYAGLFDWLVDKINSSLFPGIKAKGTYIGILDIFGFENFEENSFEQLCINYANEKLQQQFCRHEFNLRQQEYRQELGNDFPQIEYQDNRRCIELLEGANMAPGIFALLDQEAKMPGKRAGIDFVSSLMQTCKGNDLLTTLRHDRSAFQVAHFSDAVKYQANDMNGKNKDDISKDVMDLMAGSSNNILKALGKKMKEESDKRTGLKTVGARFRQEMKEMESTLDSTDLHFVRCIKPTDKPTPPNVQFDQKKVMDQLRSAGILAVAQLAKSGFPTRYEISRFVSMYSSLNLRSSAGIRLLSTGMTGWLEARDPTAADCGQLLQHLGVKEQEYAIGKTKIFFRTGVLGRVEDQYAATKYRLQLLSNALRRMQWNRWLKIMRKRVLTVQNTWRCKVARAELRQRRVQAEKARAEAERQLRDALLLERQKTIMAQLAREARVKSLLRLKRKEEEQAELRRQELEAQERRRKEEGERRRKDLEEQERRRREAEEQESRRKELEEQERKRKVFEEQERKRKVFEEQERKRKEAEERERKRKEAEEQERRRKEAEEKEQRKELQEQERRRKEAEEDEQEKKQAEEQERTSKHTEAAEKQKQLEEQERKPHPKMKLVPVTQQHGLQARQCLEQVTKERSPNYEHIAEVMNFFLDVSRKLGDDMALLQQVVSGQNATPYYYDARMQHNILRQSLVRFETRFIKYNLARAQQLLRRDSRDAAQFSEACRRVEHIFREWVTDMKACLVNMEPYLPQD